MSSWCSGFGHSELVHIVYQVRVITPLAHVQRGVSFSRVSNTGVVIDKALTTLFAPTLQLKLKLIPHLDPEHFPRE